MQNRGNKQETVDNNLFFCLSGSLLHCRYEEIRCLSEDVVDPGAHFSPRLGISVISAQWFQITPIHLVLHASDIQYVCVCVVVYF